MKIKELKKMLEEFDDDVELVVELPQRHAMYGDIGNIVWYDESDDGEGEETIVTMSLRNLCYSPKQVIGESK